MDDTDRVIRLCKILLPVQKSDPIFEDSALDFIEIPLRGFETVEASHHRNTFKVYLSCSSAQCCCFDCVESQNTNISRVNWDDLEYHSDLFIFLLRLHSFLESLLAEACFSEVEFSLNI